MNHSPHLSSGRVRKFLPLFVLVPAGLSACLMLIACLTQYDGPAANYFGRGALLPIFAAVLSAVSAIAGTVITGLLPRGSLSSEISPVPSASFASAAGFLICAVILTASAIRSGFRWYHAVTLLLLLLSVAYFILRAYDRFTEPLRDLTVLLGIAPVFGLIFLCAIHYFDKSLEMNAPVKVLTLLGLLTATVTVTSGIRYLLGTALPRVYLMLASWTVAAGSLSLLSIPALFLAGSFDKTAYLASFFAVLGYTVSCGFRIVSLIRSAEDTSRVEEDAQA